MICVPPVQVVHFHRRKIPYGVREDPAEVLTGTKQSRRCGRVRSFKKRITSSSAWDVSKHTCFGKCGPLADVSISAQTAHVSDSPQVKAEENFLMISAP